VGYKVKEIFYSLQGEGANAGRPAVFCRFTGCNLWSGREQDRSEAVCQFCDTDFVGIDGGNGGNYSAVDLVDKVISLWPQETEAPVYVVCTGGEPLLQLDQILVDAFHKKDVIVAIETNGTLLPPKGVDWVCVSPKANADFILQEGNELKLVFPQEYASPEKFTDLKFDYFYLQPMDGDAIDLNTVKTLAYCMEHPKWRMSVQLHKILNIE